MGRFHLHLTDAEFFALTPRQFHLLLDRHREMTEHQEFLAGIVASAVANFSLGAPKQPLRPKDFMPTRAVSKLVKVRTAPRSLIAQNIRCFMRARMGGS